jgi:demethylmenaquinone methyltransferase/2-methoxy-6-polyprenyl-1,4-benzoquinol methylase
MLAPAVGTQKGQEERQFVRKIYGRRARFYDFTANLYYLIGFREKAIRRRAVAALELTQGSTVVEIGCGTGLNFTLLQKAIGPSGHIIGVDLTADMLEQAERRVVKQGWKNVELVNQDALDYVFPDGIDGVLSTFAISLIPECGQIISKGALALASGGHLVIADLKVPRRFPQWAVSLLLPTVKPFAVTQETIKRRPWDDIRKAMEDSLQEVTVEDYYFGLAYIAKGKEGVHNG